ncbi:MAG: hypothetical protein ACRDZM_07225, partial [Acidimicrobiia bacterium]
MIDLLERADPAVGHEANKARLRAKVDEKIGISAPLRPILARTGRPWLVAVVGFAVGILLISVPALLRTETPSPLALPVGDLGNLPGVEQVVPLASGGVQTAAVDGDTIWVVTALARELQMVSASSGRIQATYSIDGYVEGVVVGGGYVWLLSYDNGGEVLRFDPADGSVDLTIPIGGEPWYGADWFADRLWVSNHKSELIQISPEGEILANDSGELKGEGLGYHWLNDPGTGLISSLANDGTRGEMVISTDGTINPVGSGIRSVTETGGYLWLMHGDYPYASAISRFDPTTGTLEPIPITVGLLGMTDFDGSLWVTSSTDDLLVRVDPESGEISRYPMPGKPGGLFEAGGSLWVLLHQPGALIRLDTEADLIETGETALETGTNGHRLLCTGNRDSGGPTVLLEPSEWIDYGSWSVIQAELSGEGHLVCAN